MARAQVRDAAAADAVAVAAVQLAVWRGPWAEFLPPRVVAALDDDAVAASWRAAITEPGGAHLLVATEGEVVVGFAAGQGDEVVALLVDPRWGRRGHGGRLLGVLAERLAADGAAQGHVWLAEHDAVSRAFVTRHGWPVAPELRSSTHGARTLRERRHAGPVPLPWRDELVPG